MSIWRKISLIPLAFREQTASLIWLDRTSVSIFIIDYLLLYPTRLKNKLKAPSPLTIGSYPVTNIM